MPFLSSLNFAASVIWNAYRNIAITELLKKRLHTHYGRTDSFFLVPFCYSNCLFYFYVVLGRSVPSRCLFFLCFPLCLNGTQSYSCDAALVEIAETIAIKSYAAT